MNLLAEILESLLAFHAVTGCDTTSQFTSFGIKTAWQVFKQCSHLLNKVGEHEIPSRAIVSVVEEFAGFMSLNLLQNLAKWFSITCFEDCKQKLPLYHHKGMP